MPEEKNPFRVLRETKTLPAGTASARRRIAIQESKTWKSLRGPRWD